MSELYMTTLCKRCHINNHYERMNCWYCGNDLHKEDSFKKGDQTDITDQDDNLDYFVE